MSRKSHRLWEQARRNVKALPARPPSTSEPAFAHFMFSSECGNCAAPYSWKTLEGHALRLCKECYYELTVCFHTTACRRLNLQPPREIYGFNWAEECLPLQEPYYQHPCDSPGCMPLVLKSDVDDLYEEVVAFGRSLHESSNPNENDSGDREVIYQRWRDFVDELVSRRQQRAEELEKVLDWVREQDQRRSERQARIENRRFHIIIDRLSELGWGDEIEFLGQKGLKTMSKLPIINLLTDLTEAAWQETLKSRLNVLEKAIVAHYVPSLPRTAQMDCRPHPIDFALEPECRAILDVPVDKTVTVEQLSPIIPALATKWDADRRRALLDYITPLLGEVAPSVDPLRLAIAHFRADYRICSRQNEAECIMRYPDILASTPECRYSLRHAMEKDVTGELKDEDKDKYAYTIKRLHWGSPAPDGSDAAYYDYDPEKELHVPHSLAKLAEAEYGRAVVDSYRRVVAALGFDPARATFDELQQCDRWLRCATCESERPQGGKIRAWSWLGAAEHDRMHHNVVSPRLLSRDENHDAKGSDTSNRRRPSRITNLRVGLPIKWQTVDEEGMARVRALVKEKEGKRRLPLVLLSCSLCPDYNTYNDYAESPGKMPRHMRKM
ncbi:hypothetical protein C8Q77DRAFT_882355 [Trametes polyzona]|nr:hypothetical protein C8Q77DRAFT_882355 [Trametes polyzona]